MRRALLCVALALASPAAAQPAPDAATLAAARRLIQASDLTGQLRAVMPQIADAALAQARRGFKSGQMPEELQSRIVAALRENMASLADVFTPELQDRMAGVYARHFSRADLDHLADLLSDPAMVRFRQGTPAMMGEIMPMMMAAMEPRQKALQTRIMKIIGDWIAAHPEDKSRLASPVRS
jgi:hypothetical protein